jgi:hypothetical protein
MLDSKSLLFLGETRDPITQSREGLACIYDTSSDGQPCPDSIACSCLTVMDDVPGGFATQSTPRPPECIGNGSISYLRANYFDPLSSQAILDTRI